MIDEGLGEVPSWDQEAEAGKEPKRGPASKARDLVGVGRPKPLLAMVIAPEEKAPLAGDLGVGKVKVGGWWTAGLVGGRGVSSLSR